MAFKPKSQSAPPVSAYGLQFETYSNVYEPLYSYPSPVVSNSPLYIPPSPMNYLRSPTPHSPSIMSFASAHEYNSKLARAPAPQFIRLKERDLFGNRHKTYRLLVRPQSELKPYTAKHAPDKIEIRQTHEVSYWTPPNDVNAMEHGTVLCGVTYYSGDDDMELDDLWFVMIPRTSDYWTNEVHNFMNKFNIVACI
eukprot:854565_1